MDYMFPSRNNENLLHNLNKVITNHGNVNLSQEEEPPLFMQFPSPFLDEMDTNNTIFPNLHHHHLSIHGHITATTTTIGSLTNPLKLIDTTKEPLASKLKIVRKKRSVGKKDRHSKIHTSLGLRDRRMRLSVHTARKFFDLNDMLGFDKASKTIEWLFNKSKKAIDEVAETLHSDDANQTDSKGNKDIESSLSAGETESMIEITAGTHKDEYLELEGDPDQIRDDSELVTKSRDEARTRDRMMIKTLKKPKHLFQTDPNVDFDQSHLEFSHNLDNQNMEESSCYPLEYSNTYHFLKHLHLDNTVRDTDTYFDHNKAAAETPSGWLNSRNSFLGFLGGWDSEHSKIESNNGIMPNIAALTSSINGENPDSGINSSSFVNFLLQNQGQ